MDLTEDRIVLHTHSEYNRNTIVTRYTDILQKAMKELFGTEFSVSVLSDEDMDAYIKQPRTSPNFDPFAGDVFTFEKFIVGPSNRMAFAAAKSVSESPAVNYNPLLIYGDSGLGKTHLIYSIAHSIRLNFPRHKIVYIKGDDFTNELVSAIQTGRNSEFREKYRQADLLLVDDIQFIAGKQQTQEEFFHTFNTLYESGKQIVLTSDRPPREMTLLDDRLRTRFEWGLMADVAPPDYETRLAIIRNKAAFLGIKLTDSVMDYIAENVTANVRQIEGILNKLLAYRDLLGDEPDEKALERAIADTIKEVNSYITPEYIISTVCRYYKIDDATLRGQERRRDVVNARQIAMYLLRRMIPAMSLSEIGKEFEGRDHTTVLHSLDKVEKQMRADPAFAEVVKEITTNINAKR